MQPKIKNALAALAAVLFSTVVFWRAALLVPGRALVTDVLLRYFYPMHEFTRGSLHSLHLPLWNPHISSGAPFLASLQPALCYPFTYAAMLFNFPGAAAFAVTFHTALGAAFMYLFAGALGVSFPAALGASAVFAFNGFFSMHYSFPNQMAAYAWLPAIAYFLKKNDSTGDDRFLLAAALALALQLCSGHPYFSACSLAVLLTLKPFLLKNISWKRFLLFPAGSAALAAVQLLPTFFLAAGSQRLTGATSAWGAVYSIPPGQLLKMLLPLWNRYLPGPDGDPHIQTFYVGILALALAAGAFRWRDRAKTMPFILLSAAGFILALGSYSFFYTVLWEYFPPARLFRFPAQALYLSCFGLSVCAAYGIDRLPGRTLRALAPALIYLELLAFSSPGIRTVDSRLYSDTGPAKAAVLGAGTYDRVLMAPGSRQVKQRSGKSELDAWMGFKATLLPNTAMALGLYDADNFEELKLADYEDILRRLYTSPFSPWIDLLSVRHMVSFSPLPPKKYAPEAGLPYLFLNGGALPRAYFTDTAVCYPHGQVLDAVEKIYARGSRLYGAVVLEEDCRPAEARKTPPVLVPARITAYSPDAVKAACSAPAEGWLVLSDAFSPGWKAAVNGAPAKTLRADYALRAVRVPKGDSIVTFKYQPAEFYAGALLTLISCAFFVLAWLRAARARPLLPASIKNII